MSLHDSRAGSRITDAQTDEAQAGISLLRSGRARLDLAQRLGKIPRPQTFPWAPQDR